MSQQNNYNQRYLELRQEYESLVQQCEKAVLDVRERYRPLLETARSVLEHTKREAFKAATGLSLHDKVIITDEIYRLDPFPHPLKGAHDPLTHVVITDINIEDRTARLQSTSEHGWNAWVSWDLLVRYDND